MKEDGAGEAVGLVVPELRGCRMAGFVDAVGATLGTGTGSTVSGVTVALAGGAALAMVGGTVAPEAVADERDTAEPETRGD